MDDTEDVNVVNCADNMEATARIPPREMFSATAEYVIAKAVEMRIAQEITDDGADSVIARILSI